MQDLFMQNFRGIRKVNPVVDVQSAGIISAVSCRNVELKYTENGDNVAVRDLAEWISARYTSSTIFKRKGFRVSVK